MKCSIYQSIFLFTLLLVTISMVDIISANSIISIEEIQIPEKGKTLGVLMISEVSNLGSFSINLSWNPSIVKINRISGDKFSLYPYFNHDIGFVNITGWTINVVNGSGVIANILFEALGSGGSSCPLEITYCQLLTADLQPNEIDCSYDENLTTITITEVILDNNNNDTLTTNTALTDTKQDEDNTFWYVFNLIVIIVLIIIGATIGRKLISQKKFKSKEK